MHRHRPIAAVRWVREAITAFDERVLVRDVVSLLLQIPTAKGEKRLALAPSHLDRAPVAQMPEPLTYTPESGVVPPLPPLKPPKRSKYRETRVRASRLPIVDLVDESGERAATDEWLEADRRLGIIPQPIARRPGQGGRQQPLQVYTMTTATAKLYEEFGDPIVSRHGDAVMLIWIVHEDGDGIVGARLSGRDVQNGETAMEQVHPALAAARTNGLRARLIVVTTENSGGLSYDERCDFDLIEREIFAGRCRWVWYRDVKRLIRNVSPFYRFRDTLLETDTDLWLTDYVPRNGEGSPIDWDSDDIQLGIEAIIAERDRKSIYKQTHGPLMTRWLGEGRGWPGSLRFGFRRNPLTKFVEVDPEQWPFVRMTFETYAASEDGKGGGIRAVRAALAAAGCPLSDTSIKRLLGDPIYVTGEYTVERAGVIYECRPIELTDPIPADLFARVQQLRKLRRGKETRNPAGYFPLNGIVEHSCGCRLRARSIGDRETVTYLHYFPKGGAVSEACRGWSVDARELERAVIREVRRLAGCRKLQEEWASIARPQFAEPDPILDDSARDALLAEIARLTKMSAQLETDFIRKIGSGEEKGDSGATLMAFHQLTGGLTEQIKAGRERLARMDVLDNVRRSTRPAESDPLLKVLLEVLTEEVPDDPQLVRRRASLLETVLSKVVVYDREDCGIEIELHGPLVPDDVPPLRPLSPVVAGRPQLLDAVAGQDPEGPIRATERRIRSAREAGAVGSAEAAEMSADRCQPDRKPYLTDQLAQASPPPLPKLGRPGGRRQRRATRSVSTPSPSVAPAWVSPRLSTHVTR